MVSRELSQPVHPAARQRRQETALPLPSPLHPPPLRPPHRMAGQYSDRLVARAAGPLPLVRQADLPAVPDHPGGGGGPLGRPPPRPPGRPPPPPPPGALGRPPPARPAPPAPKSEKHT